jgi:hypothetical protein
MTNKFLQDQAAALANFAKETRERANTAPSDFFLQLAAKVQEDAAQDSARALALAQSEQAGELVDLRLIGPRADGNISLDWFIDAMEPLSKAWKLAAYRLRYGNDPTRGVGSDVVNALNLKLAGLAYGSTRILVTGNAIPDLTGESLLQATLTQTFRLLNASQEDFYDAVDAMGGKSAHQLGRFMKSLDDVGLAAQITWQSPKGRRFWEGRPDEIARIRALLDTLKEPERYEEMIEGRVAGITDTGRLDLRTDDGKVSIRFPLQLTEQVQRLTITSPTRLRVETARYRDNLEKRDIYKRNLIRVES